jgi:hypothetical protein
VDEIRKIIREELKRIMLNESWKPLMSKDEALSWNSNSVYKNFVYHTTWSQSLDSILKNGFQFGKSFHSRPNYEQTFFHFSSKPGNMNVSYGDVLLTCAINVKNPIPLDEFWELREEIDNSPELKKEMESRGYDSFLSIPSDLWIFNPEDVTVVSYENKNKKKRKSRLDSMIDAYLDKREKGLK